MAAPLCFIDTETTGIHPGRQVWEIAMIRRDDIGQHEASFFVDVDLSNADPFGLSIGRFYDRHPMGRALCVIDDVGEDSISRADAANRVAMWTHAAHLVGAIPNFDAETLDLLLRDHGLIPAWHYHLIDVENLAVGWLQGRRARQNEIFDGYPIENDGAQAPGLVRWNEPLKESTPPWKSDDLSRACGVEPPSDEERHTALGDARWALRLYNAITGTSQHEGV